MIDIYPRFGLKNLCFVDVNRKLFIFIFFGVIFKYFWAVFF